MPVSLTALYTYPIKSAGRLEHDQIALETTGPLYDRRWMVVYDRTAQNVPGIPDAPNALDESDAPYRSISQREIPRLALIQPRIDETARTLTLTAPGMPPLTLPLDEPEGERVPALILNTFHTRSDDMGKEAAVWLTRFLDTPARLMRMPQDEVRPVSMDYTDQPAQTSFTDGYPLLIVSEASLVELNRRLEERGKAPVEMARFRTNLLVNGTQPFEEDDWARIRINGVEFEVAKPCGRCKITTVDQATGTIPDAKEPTATLATFRRWPDGKVMFGQNMIHRGLGTLELGATVEVLRYRESGG